MSILWINGVFQDGEVPVFTAKNRIRYGDGVFDTMLAIDGDLLLPEIHLERLIKHANILGISLPPSLGLNDFKKTADALLFQNGLKTDKAAINTIVTRGDSARGLTISSDQKITMIMTASKVSEALEPIKAIISKTVRRNEGSPLSRIKSLNYGDHVLALKEAGEKDANETILMNNQGNITCATIGNIFVEKQGQLFTPPLSDGVLDGITRRCLIKEYDAQEQSLKPQDLKNCDGIYITNSIRGAVAVHSLDGIDMPHPSVITSTLHTKIKA